MQQISRELQGVEIAGFYGLLKNRNTYEIMDPEAMGISRSMIVLGKHSGSHAIKHRLEEFGITLGEEELAAVYKRFKEKADGQKMVSDEELVQIAGDSTHTRPDPYALTDLLVHAGIHRSRSATAMIRDNESGQEKAYLAIGAGPVEAVIHAIGQAIPVAAEFEDMELHSLSTGEDAHGEAVVSIIHKGRRYRGTSSHKDIILAAAQAYISACNGAIMTERGRILSEGRLQSGS